MLDFVSELFSYIINFLEIDNNFIDNILLRVIHLYLHSLKTKIKQCKSVRSKFLLWIIVKTLLLVSNIRYGPIISRPAGDIAIES
jgi:hypothetical protein